MSAAEHEDVSWIRVATRKTLEEKGVLVVRGADRPIAVYAHDGVVSAVDNRCPHLGFPLHRGTVQDGILTCHWHHARFDLCSGCTFDLFADDVPAYDVQLRGPDGDEVYVASTPRQTDLAHHYRRRLREGMEQNISLIQAKCIIGLLRGDVDYREIVQRAVPFGAAYRDGWASGLTILITMANLVPYLDEETAYLALYQGTRRVAADCAGQTPRRNRHPLETDALPLDTLKRWLRYWTTVRHRDGAERTLLTAIRSGFSREALAELVFSAATERFYADTGHSLDFCNKAFEALDLIGWEHAEQVLPTVMGQLVAARGGEEMNAWRHPVDLVPSIQSLAEELPELLQRGAETANGKEWEGTRSLADAILGEDPLAILAAIRGAVLEGARPNQLSRALAYSAAMRIARFGTANEFGDWITALHTFTFCNALHQAILRAPTPDVVRGVLHGAVSVYLDRFLNVPPARLPGERDYRLNRQDVLGDLNRQDAEDAKNSRDSGSAWREVPESDLALSEGDPARTGRGGLEELPGDAAELLQGFLTALDQQQEVEAAARAVSRYLKLGHPVQPLFNALTRAVVREDADFHTFQMVEAAVRQYHEWEGKPEGEQILLAAARYLAAHAPTQRAQLQTAQIALRLHRGDSLYEEDGDG